MELSTFVFVNCLALSLCWFASAGVYLASKRQKILSSTLSKAVAWFVFCALNTFAFVMLTSVHHGLSAFVILLSFVMTAWIALALIAPYFPTQKSTLIYGSMLTLIVAAIGGFYVV